MKFMNNDGGRGPPEALGLRLGLRDAGGGLAVAVADTVTCTGEVRPVGDGSLVAEGRFSDIF